MYSFAFSQLGLGVLASALLKNLVFRTTKIYFIYYNTNLQLTLYHNIISLIFHFYLFFYPSLSLSLSLIANQLANHTPTTLHHHKPTTTVKPKLATIENPPPPPKLQLTIIQPPPQAFTKPKSSQQPITKHKYKT